MDQAEPATEPDPSGNRARQLMFAPELGLTFLENCPSKPASNRSGPIASTGLSMEPASGQAAQRTTRRGGWRRLVLSTQHVELQWVPAQHATGYQVERAVVEVLTEDQLTRLKTQTPPLAEPSVGAIRRIGAFERLTATPLKEPAFSDTKIDLTRKETVTGDPIYERKLNLEQIDPAGQPYRFTFTPTACAL
jgi:hypothetical protein